MQLGLIRDKANEQRDFLGVKLSMPVKSLVVVVMVACVWVDGWLGVVGWGGE